MRCPWAPIAAVAALAVAPPAGADETTLCNAYITSLPYTISTQGHYCFDRNLSTPITTGNAITINADFVVLDLNNFKLGGGAAGLGTEAIGIFSENHRNITIRNGNIRGFRQGIHLDGSPSTSGGHVIENNVLDANTYVGAWASGDTVVMRNNVVSNTGGSSLTGALGLYSSYLSFMSTRDNVITNTFATTYAFGICCGKGQHDRNLIRCGPAGAQANGILGAGEATVCRDNTVFGANGPYPLGACVPVGHNFTSP